MNSPSHPRPPIALHAVALATAMLALFTLVPPMLAQSLLDVTISHVPPADEAEDPGFPQPNNPAGANPIEFFDAHSWRLFIALNWPAKTGERGVADTSKDISDATAPRVWETWKSASDIFQPNGAEPSAWESFDAAPLCPDDTTPQQPGVKFLPFSMVGPVLEDFNQVNAAGFAVGSLVARNQTYVRYEVRVNKLMFDPIRSKKLYLRKTLEELTQPVVFPDESIEVKAAWRELKDSPEDNALRDRCYHVEARSFNPETKTCETKRFAMIGFHIGQKTKLRRQWIWSTFEHVDTLDVGVNSPAGTQSLLIKAPNAASASPPTGGITATNPPKPTPTPTDVHRLETNLISFSRPFTDATNKKWQEHEKIKNTVWKNYRLVLTQWPTVKQQETGPGSPFPRNNVANVTMETFQELQRSSCITCHLQTPFPTDFAWFLALRAFPVPPSEGVIAGNVPNAARARELKEHLRKAVERSLTDGPEPKFE